MSDNKTNLELLAELVVLLYKYTAAIKSVTGIITLPKCAIIHWKNFLISCRYLFEVDGALDLKR